MRFAGKRTTLCGVSLSCIFLRLMEGINPYRSNNIDGIYRSIGKFVVEFSHLHSMIELMTVHLLSPSGKSEMQQRAWAVISGQTTRPAISNLFSLVIESKGDEWTSEDMGVLNAVRKEIIGIIEERNRIAHDIWSLGHPNSPLPEGSDAQIFRYKASPRKGAITSSKPVTVQDIDQLSSDVNRLRKVIMRIGAIGISQSPHSPADVFILDDNKIVSIRDQEE